MTKAHGDKEKTKIMNYKTVKYSVFTGAMSKLGIVNPGDFSEALGYSRSAHNVWRKSGRFPQTASLACECFLRRHNKEETKISIDLYFLTVPKQHSLAIESFCKALKINTQLIDFSPAA